MRANWTFLTLGVFGIISLLSMSFTIAEIDLLMRIERGAFVSEDTLAGSDDRQLNVGVLRLLAFVATVVAFCFWIHRASENLVGLGIDSQRFSPGWSVGWWFVPIAMLFRPYQVMKEIWSASYPSSVGRGEAAWQDAPVSPLLGWWWLAWLVGGVVEYSAYRMFTLDEGATITQFIRGDWLLVAGDGLTLLATVLLFVLVWQITSNQGIKRVRLQN